MTSTSFRVRALLAALLASTLVVLVLPARSHAAVILNARTDFTLSTVNPCTGESIFIEGTAHMLLTQTVDQGGGQHFVEEGNRQGTGISASGARYVLVSTGTFVETPANDTAGFTERSTFKVIRAAEASTPDDFTMTILFKGLVVNGQGVVDIERSETTCT